MASRSRLYVKNGDDQPLAIHVSWSCGCRNIISIRPLAGQIVVEGERNVFGSH